MYISAPLPGVAELDAMPVAEPGSLLSFDILTVNLEAHGFVVLPEALPPEVARSLVDYARRLTRRWQHIRRLMSSNK